MDDLNPSPGSTTQAPGTSSPIAQTTLHYVAGAALLGLAAWGATADLVDKTTLTELIIAAALAVGFKLKGS